MNRLVMIAILAFAPLELFAAINAGLPGVPVLDVDVSKSNPSTAYTATRAGIFKTDDAGRTWTLVNTDTAGTDVAVSPSNADTAYVAVAGGIIRTTDRGATWKIVMPNTASALAIAPSDPKTLYAAFAQGMAKSTDAGDSWQFVNGNLFLGYYSGFHANSIAVDPSSASTVWVSNGDETVKSTVGGNTWQYLSEDIYGLLGLTVDPLASSTLFAGKRTTGVIKSIDSGATWVAAGLSDKHVTTLAKSGPTLYAGTDDGRLYRSDDGGQTWIGFDDGMHLAATTRVVAGGTHLYAATANGVFEFETVDQNVAPLRLPDDVLRAPRTIDDIANTAAPNAALLIPVAGSVRGLGGTRFTTELILSNAHAASQTVQITWLPRGADGGTASFNVTIPGTSDPSGGTLKIRDLGQQLGMDGIGSLVISAVDAAGHLDATASIDASTIVWGDPADGRAPVSQSIPAAHAALFASHGHAQAIGRQQSDQFRMNVGIVNLSTVPHQFTIQINGGQTSGQFTIAVPPLSMVQTALPPGDYGIVTLDVFADSGSARWVLYGNTIDRSTGESQTTLGTP